MRTIENIEDFREWLLMFNAEDTVGKSCDGSDCPLARYSGADDIGGDDSYFDLVMNEYKRMPDWAAQFIWLSDNHFLGSAVTAGKALEILENCKN